MDGCIKNAVLLDTFLRSRYQQFKSTFAATLDLARVFDSMEHSAIMREAEAAGIPPLLINYFKNLKKPKINSVSFSNGYRGHHSSPRSGSLRSRPALSPKSTIT